jgi:hypothetical protein
MAFISMFGTISNVTAGTTSGCPLKFKVSGTLDRADIAIFTDNQALTNDLAAAINSVIEKHAAPVPALEAAE